jgi:hypothetical protein
LDWVLLGIVATLVGVALSSPLSCLYYSMECWVCQEVFSTFFKFFSSVRFLSPSPLDNYSIANVVLFVNPFREKKFFYFLIKFLLTKAETCVIMEILPAHIRARGAKLMPIKKTLLHECKSVIAIVGSEPSLDSRRTFSENFRSFHVNQFYDARVNKF